MPFLEELKSLADAAGVTVKLSSSANIAGDSFVSIVETMGMRSRYIQNDTTGYEQPRAQVTVFATDFVTARNLARTLHSAFNKRNAVVGAVTQNVSSIIRSGTVATATSQSHGFVTGQQITIAGATQAEYNGTFSITVIDANRFSFTVAGSPATTATGTITASFAGTRYLFLEPLQPPFDMGTDANSRARVTFNVRAIKDPS